MNSCIIPEGYRPALNLYDTQVAIAMTKDNSGWSTGYIFVPSRSGAADALREYAAGHSEMGAVFIQYGGETYVVALFL